MKKKMYSVYTLFRSVGAVPFYFNTEVDRGEGPEEMEVFTSEDFEIVLENAFSDCLFLARWDEAKEKAENITEAAAVFLRAFERWREHMYYNSAVLWQALYNEYNPLENYDRKEDGGWTDAHHKGTRTEHARNETVTPNITNTTIDTPRAKVKAASFVYGVNSATGSPDAYTESEGISGENTTTNTQTGSSTTSADAAQNYTVVKDASATEFDKDVRTMDGYRVHGNIGVTKATDLINSEFETRKKDLAEFLIYDFFERYTFYCSSGEVVE